MTQDRDGLCSFWSILTLKSLAFKPFVIHFDRKEHKYFQKLEENNTFSIFCLFVEKSGFWLIFCPFYLQKSCQKGIFSKLLRCHTLLVSISFNFPENFKKIHPGIPDLSR